MTAYTKEDETMLWKMYIWSGVAAISEVSDADGIVILRTKHDREFRFPFRMTDSLAAWSQDLVDTLAQEYDTNALYMIYVWKNHWLDVPAADLRKKLLSLHPQNEKTLVILIGEEGFVIKTLSQINNGMVLNGK